MRLPSLTLRLPPNTLRAGAEAVLVALLAFQAACLTWIVVTPQGPFGAVSTPRRADANDVAALTHINPFIGKSAPVEANAGEGLKLVGVRADGEGGGSAFFSDVNARHSVYAVGEEISPGTKLKAVAADHVVLLRAGAELRVPLISVAATGAGPVPAYLMAAPVRAPKRQAAAPAVVATEPSKLLEQVGLRPRVIDGRVAGYTLLPRGDSALMRAAGLEAGDVLVALNGNQLTPERYSELAQELDAPEVQLTVQRGAEMRTITLKTGK